MELSGWPGTRAVMQAPKAEVFLVAREVVLEEGYRIAVEKPEAGCLRSDFKTTGSAQLGRTLLTGIPPITEQAVEVRVKEEGEQTQLAIWLFPKSRNVYVKIGQAILAAETRRLVKAIKQRLQ